VDEGYSHSKNVSERLKFIKFILESVNNKKILGADHVERTWSMLYLQSKEDSDASNPLNPGNFKKVKLLPDGAALFTRGMGMNVVWEKERGFGERSWRYAVVINDMKIEKLFVEGGSPKEDYGPDPFEVSDAKTVLSYLQSKK
jgi:hypothetical protein